MKSPSADWLNAGITLCGSQVHTSGGGSQACLVLLGWLWHDIGTIATLCIHPLPGACQGREMHWRSCRGRPPHPGDERGATGRCHSPSGGRWFAVTPPLGLVPLLDPPLLGLALIITCIQFLSFSCVEQSCNVGNLLSDSVRFPCHAPTHPIPSQFPPAPSCTNPPDSHHTPLPRPAWPARCAPTHQPTLFPAHLSFNPTWPASRAPMHPTSTTPLSPIQHDLPLMPTHPMPTPPLSQCHVACPPG